MAKLSKKPLTVMVSSTVYGLEDLLEQTFALLERFGYKVWMSHKGTMPVLSDVSAFENCLAAVEACDIFLGIITPQYGSGKGNKEGRSITHLELLKAIQLNMPRWMVVHNHVVFARKLLRNLGYKTQKQRTTLSLKKTPLLEDLRVIDMYEAAIRNDIRLNDRKGNWVQPYASPMDILSYVNAQLYPYDGIESYVKRRRNSHNVRSKIGGRKRK